MSLMDVLMPGVFPEPNGARAIGPSAAESLERKERRRAQTRRNVKLFRERNRERWNEIQREWRRRRKGGEPQTRVPAASSPIITTTGTRASEVPA